MNILQKEYPNLEKANIWTAEKLAWSADLSKSCVSYAEKGTKDIKISTINAICNAMGITLAEFFSIFVKNIED